VRGFVNQADGALQVRANGGTRYVIEFPVIPIPNDENIREGQDQFAFEATREKLG
jgi:hypothetical protein